MKISDSISSIRESRTALNFVQSRLGVTTLLLIAVGLGAVSVKFGLIAGLLILIAMIAIPVVYAMVVFPIFGICCLITVAFALFFILRLGINFPLGTLLDAMQVLLLLGFFIKQRSKPDWSMFKGPVATVILIWIGYNILEVGNPWAASRLAWVYTVRTIAILTLMYFVFVYQIKQVQTIRMLVLLWIIFTVIGAIYGYKQEYFGIAPNELAEMEADPLSKSLLFIDGHWRKYSIFSDPVEFSYNMVITALLCITLIFGPGSFLKKAILGVLAMVMLYSTLFSGTRGSYVLVPVALVLFVIMNFNKWVFMMACVGAFFIVVLIFIPTGNPALVRFQSAFRPSDDASYNVRAINQKRIQPFIQSHPFGGGLGSTGIWGARFAPGAFLSIFPPDSGYVRVAVEMGWVGLLIFCCFMFVILKSGIDNYYAIRDPELKTYCLGMTLVIFALNIGNFPQEALVQYPNNILFYLAVAIIQVCRRIDQKTQSSLR